MHLYRIVTASIAFTMAVQTVNLDGEAQQHNIRYLMTGIDDSDICDDLSLAQTTTCSQEDGLCCPCPTPKEEDEKIKGIVDKLAKENAERDFAASMNIDKEKQRKDDTLKLEAGAAVMAKL